MRCEHIQDRLSAFLEDELDPGERGLVEAHLAQCLRCRQELALLRRTVSTLRSLEEIDVSPRLTAGIQAGIRARQRSRWQDLASWLFFPIHIKVPLEALALVLITFGAVYLYRSAPELAHAPRPGGTPEATFRDAGAPSMAGRRGNLEKPAAPSKESAAEVHSRFEVQEEREARKQTDAVARSLRKEAPAGAVGDISSVPEMILRTENPSLAASRIANIVEGLGGKLLEKKEDDQLLLRIPASSYPRFLAALRELGQPMQPPAEPQPAPSGEGTVTISLRLIR